MKVVFFGASKFVIPILETLRKNFELPLVITTELNPTDAVPAYCKSTNIPYITIKQFNNATIEEIKTVNAKVAVLAYFGLILPEKVLDLFSKGIINVHPSLLPKYRGATPGQTAILNGDTTTGVTIIKLDKEVDHGPILVQIEESIQAKDTAETLYERLFTKGASLLTESLNTYLKNERNLEEQNHQHASFTKLLKRNDGFIDATNP